MTAYPLVQACTTFAEWKRLRATFIGASEAAAVLGISPWRTAGDVWIQKVRAQEALENDAASDDSDEVPNRFSFWGSRLEPVIIDAFAAESGYTVERPGLTICRHPDHPFIAATLDARAVSPAGDKSVVEAKATDSFYQYRERVWGPTMTDHCPEWYLIQVTQQLEVVKHEGYDLGWLAVLIGGNDFRRYPIPYDRELAEMLVERLVEFWRLVERREPPPFDYADKGALDLQRRIWNRVEGTSIVVPANYSVAPSMPTVLELIIERDDAKAAEEEAKARFEAAQAAIVHLAGNNARVEIDGTGIAIVRKQKAGHHVPAYDVQPYIETSFTPRLTKKRKEILDGYRQQTNVPRAIDPRTGRRRFGQPQTPQLDAGAGQQHGSGSEGVREDGE